MLIIPWKAAVF